MSGGGGSSSDSGGGNQQASAKAAMTGNAAYSGSTKPSAPPGGGATSQGSNRDYSPTATDGDRITRIAEGIEPGYRPQDSRPFGLSKEEAYKQGKITVDQRDAQPSITEQTERDITRDLTFSEQWNLAPDALKFSPVLRFLYASGKNIGEYFQKKNFQSYGTNTQESLLTTNAERDRNIMRDLAGEAPYIVSGTQKPDSVAANWYKNLGSGGNEFFFSKGYADAKAKQQSILGNPSAIRYLAVNESPFYDWLKTNSLDKGIL